MLYAPTLITPPADAPLSLEEAKLFVRVDGDALDDEIAMHIAATIADAQRIGGIRIGTQSVDVGADRFEDLAHLEVAPVSTIVSITYEDLDGDDQVVAPAAYQLSGGELDPEIRLKVGASWPYPRPITRAIRVRLQVGYTGETLPADLRRALLLDIRGRFDGVPVDLPALLVNHRIWL